MANAGEFLVRHGYALLFLWILCEQSALPLPSVPLLLAAGALVRAGRMDLQLVLLSALAGCLIADIVWFQLGRLRGSGVLKFICRIALEPDSCVRKTENALVRYGERSLLFAKFVPGLNTVAAPLAGSSRTPFGRFLLFDSAGAALWIGFYTGIGFLFSDQLESVAAYAGRLGSGVVALLIGLLAGWLVWKFCQRRRFLRKISVARITAEELAVKLEAGEPVVVVDVRGLIESESGRIPTALQIPVEEFEQRHAEIPRDRDIILFCS